MTIYKKSEVLLVIIDLAQWRQMNKLYLSWHMCFYLSSLNNEEYALIAALQAVVHTISYEVTLCYFFPISFANKWVIYAINAGKYSRKHMITIPITVFSNNMTYFYISRDQTSILWLKRKWIRTCFRLQCWALCHRAICPILYSRVYKYYYSKCFKHHSF